MIYGFYSDTHKGDGSKADNFRRVKPKVKRMLVWLNQNCDHIFNLGDDKEVTQGRGSTADILEDIATEHGDVLKMEKKLGVVKVNGNHDEGTIPLKKVDFTVDTIRIIAEHGHRFDRWCSKLWFIGRIGAKFAGWLERKGFWNAEKILGKLAERAPGRKEKLSTYFDQMKKEIDKGVKKWRTKVVYLIGHVHRLTIEDYGNHILVAVGHCSSGKCSCVIVDTDKGTVTKKKF
jgi:predicted phosphodiesterase